MVSEGGISAAPTSICFDEAGYYSCTDALFLLTRAEMLWQVVH